MTRDNSAQSIEELRSRADSRNWTRFQLDEPPEVAIHYRGQLLPLSVCNESFGGIGMLAPLDVVFEIDQGITVIYNNAPMRGVVRFVQPYGNRQRIGIEWGSSSTDTGATGLPPAP